MWVFSAIGCLGTLFSLLQCFLSECLVIATEAKVPTSILWTWVWILAVPAGDISCYGFWEHADKPPQSPQRLVGLKSQWDLLPFSWLLVGFGQWGPLGGDGSEWGGPGWILQALFFQSLCGLIVPQQGTAPVRKPLSLSLFFLWILICPRVPVPDKHSFSWHLQA